MPGSWDFIQAKWTGIVQTVFLVKVSGPSIGRSWNAVPEQYNRFDRGNSCTAGLQIRLYELALNETFRFAPEGPFCAVAARSGKLTAKLSLRYLRAPKGH